MGQLATEFCRCWG